MARMGTPMLIKPSLDEIRLQADKIGLPEVEAERFYNHYMANGWRIGKSRMVSWTHAMAGWKIRWQEERYSGNGRNGHTIVRSLDQDLNRTIKQIRAQL